jgi:hypothetical protein
MSTHILSVALIALALTTPADSAPRKLRPVCPSGTLTNMEGVGLVCISAPKWVR